MLQQSKPRPGKGRLTTEQFGGGGSYGVGHQERAEDGSMKMEQVFFYPAAGASARVGHRSSLDGDEHTTSSFDIDDEGVWTPQRTYVWERQPSEETPASGG